jgi:adenosine deaminase
MAAISGPAAAALNSLSPSQINFLHSIPKAELHAHLNGSIPISVLQELATEYLSEKNQSTPAAVSNDTVREGIEKLMAGPVLDEIHDFFHLFPAIYSLTSTPAALARATRAVLSTFLDGASPQCTHLELRTTPRATPAMSRQVYLETVLAEIERYEPRKVGLIVSIDRRMGKSDLEECLNLACALTAAGRRVVGVDLCGDPLAGNMDDFAPYFAQAKDAGLGITLHIAEVSGRKGK